MLSRPRPGYLAMLLLLCGLGGVSCSDGAYEEADEHGNWGPHVHVDDEDFPADLLIESDLSSSHASCKETVRTDAYSAGRNFTITVVTVDGKPVEKRTADSFWRMRQDASSEGVTLRLNSGFRTNAQQQYLYNCYLSGRCNDGNLAAYPGYSRHQSGSAVDINTGYPGVVSWLDRNAHYYGFSNPIRSIEPWHWEHSSSTDSQRHREGMCDSAPQPAPFTPPFADDDGSPHEPAIAALKKAGIFSGCVAGERPKFCPDDSLTREQAAALLTRALKLPRAARDYFQDDDGTRFEQDINSVAEAGLTQGCGGGERFCPQERVTRGEFTVMLARGLRLPETPWDFFSDDAASFYESAANSARMAGLVQGCEAETFCGERYLTRAETATLLARAMELVPRVWTPFFADDDGSPHEDAINHLYKRGVFGGCAGGEQPKFCPDAALSRGQLAVVLQRALGLPLDAPDRFGDDAGSEYEGAINAIAAAGITSGCDASAPELYCPAQQVTRGQVAIFLVRAFNLPDARQDYFSDDEGSFFEDAANSLREAGISLGCEVDKFCGERDSTRAEVAQLVWRLMK